MFEQNSSNWKSILTIYSPCAGGAQSLLLQMDASILPYTHAHSHTPTLTHTLIHSLTHTKSRFDTMFAVWPNTSNATHTHTPSTTFDVYPKQWMANKKIKSSHIHELMLHSFRFTHGINVIIYSFSQYLHGFLSIFLLGAFLGSFFLFQLCSDLSPSFVFPIIRFPW